ncbi:hypothetical protein IEO21_04959 [Rhodonia placenta]|uniref:Velvet domain-containing protein n=1 Tax=Rhodonia placenta TaxID=104341 RepID=A0A8H7P2S0_9APHY|nr:hypothetical protein IEO21_04959 [Postia placenta]
MSFSHRAHVQPVPSSTIGLPVSFVAGPLAGMTLRAELEEVQSAKMGRKYGHKDRRALDPPPVVLMKLYRRVGYGVNTRAEEEIADYGSFNNVGLVCQADLFPIPDTISAGIPAGQGASPVSNPHQHVILPPVYNRSPAFPHAPGSMPGFGSSPFVIPSPPAQIFRPVYTYPPPLRLTVAPTTSQQPYASSYSFPESPTRSDVVAYYGGHALSESSKCTQLLAGTITVAAICIDYKGKKSLMFIFSDLAVRSEGTYMLRYSAYDIFSHVRDTQGHPALAQCFGGPFHIYATKDFPGLHASTDLTKHLSFYGMRLHAREHQREGKKRKADDRELQSSETAQASVGTSATSYRSSPVQDLPSNFQLDSYRSRF